MCVGWQVLVGLVQEQRRAPQGTADGLERKNRRKGEYLFMCAAAVTARAGVEKQAGSSPRRAGRPVSPRRQRSRISHRCAAASNSERGVTVRATHAGGPSQRAARNEHRHVRICKGCDASVATPTRRCFRQHRRVDGYSPHHGGCPIGTRAISAAPASAAGASGRRPALTHRRPLWRPGAAAAAKTGGGWLSGGGPASRRIQGPGPGVDVPGRLSSLQSVPFFSRLVFSCRSTV